MALTEKLSAIGDAIREKTGKEELLTLEQMSLEIASIVSGGGSSGDFELTEGTITPTSETQELRLPWEKDSLPLFWVCVRQDFDTYVTPDNPATEAILGGIVYFTCGYIRASSSKTTRYIGLKITSTTGYAGYIGGSVDFGKEILTSDGLLAYSNTSAYRWKPDVTYKYYIVDKVVA